MAARDLALQLVISAKDRASSVFKTILSTIGSVFSFIDQTTSATANLVREKLGGLFGSGIDSSIDFEAALARVQAKSNATASDMAKLKAAAIEQSKAMRLGADGSVLAAQALEQLTGAGLSVDEAIGALPATLRVAKNEQIETEKSAAALTDTMSIMNLAFNQAGRVGDVLQKSADTTSTSVSALAEAIRTGGGEAVKAGYSLEQTVVILTAFAKAGIQGSEAGTALKSLLQDIGDPASRARRELAKFGESTGDVSQFIGRLIELGPRGLQVVRSFSDEAGPGLAALLSVGTKGLEDYRKAIEQDAVGGLEKASDTINTTTRGALDRLAATWAQVKTTLAEPLLKPIADGAELLSKKLSDLQSSGILQKIGGGIAQLVIDAGNFADGVIKKFNWDELKAKANSAIADIRTALDETINAVQRKVQTVSDWTTTIFSPLNQAVDGYRIAWALANKDQAAAAQIQAQIEARTAAIGRTLSGTSAEYINAGRSAKAYGDANQNAARSTEDLQKAAQVSSEKAAALTEALAAQQAEVDRLAEANARGQASNEQYGAAVQKLWSLQAQLRDAQAAQKAAQDALNPSIANAVELQKLHAVELAKIEPATTEASNASKLYREQIAEVDRQIQVATNNAGGWREGLKLTGVQMFGLKEAADTLAQKLALVEQAQRDGLATDAEVANAKFKANAAQDLYNKALDEYIAQQERAVATVQRANELGEKSYDIQIRQKQAAVDLATAKGDLVAAAKAEAEQADLEIAKADALVAGKQKEIAAYEDSIAATQRKLEADGELSAAEQDQLAVMADKLASLKLEKEDLQSTADALRDKAVAEKEAVAATKQAADAQAAAAAAIKDHAAQLQAASEGVTTSLNGWIDRLNALSPAAVAAFEKLQGFTDSTVESTDAATEARAALDQLGETIGNLGDSGYVEWANQLAYNAQTVQAQFWGQAEAAEAFEQQLNSLQAGNQLEGLIRQAEDTRSSFDLLDQARLDNLNSAIDTAKGKMSALRDETETARLKVMELDEQEARLEGNTALADSLKLQREYLQDLSDAEASRAAATEADNQTLIDLYDQQITRIKRIHELEKESGSSKSTLSSTSSASSSSSSGGSSGGGVNITVNAGGARVLDSNFVNDLARQLTPVLSGISRRLA